MQNDTQSDWWERAIYIIKMVSPFNVLSFMVTVIGGGIRYGIDRGMARTPEYYNITQDHAKAIKRCLDENMPAASIYEAIRILFSEDWWHWEIFTYVCCISTTLLVCDLVEDVYQRYQNAISGISLNIYKSKIDKLEVKPILSKDQAEAYQAKVSQASQEARSEAIKKRFITKDFWCYFFRRGGKFNFPYKWIVNPSFAISLLYFYYSCKSHVAKFIEDIPVEYHKLINDPEYNHTDHACLDVMARGKAGKSVFNPLADIEIFLPMLTLATVVIGRDVGKYIKFFWEKMQTSGSVDDSFYQENKNICGLFWKEVCEKILGRNKSVDASGDLLLPQDFVV